MHIFLDYCERASLNNFSFEPLNTISNIGFLLAAILLFYKTKGQNLSAVLLSFIILTISIGSSLWHIYAKEPYLQGDVLPIMSFILLYIYFFLCQIIKMNKILAIVNVIIFFILNLLVENYLPSNLFNGSIMYVLPSIVLLIMLIFMLKTNHPLAKNLLYTIIIWSISIFFRTIDFMVCPYIIFGTHFIWHILNAIVLYRLANLLILNKNLKNI